MEDHPFIQAARPCWWSEIAVYTEVESSQHIAADLIANQFKWPIYFPLNTKYNHVR
jgi:hypothetical protein